LGLINKPQPMAKVATIGQPALEISAGDKSSSDVGADQPSKT
jgi:hypothetical protein